MATRHAQPRAHPFVGSVLRGEVERHHRPPGWGDQRSVGLTTGPTPPSPTPPGSLAELHARAERILTGELDRYRRRLAGLDDDQRSVVEALSRAIMASLLLRPAEILIESAGSARGDKLAEAVRDLFGLDQGLGPTPVGSPVYGRSRNKGKVQA